MTIRGIINLIEAAGNLRQATPFSAPGWGNPEGECTGIALSSLPTCRAIAKTHDFGANFLITREPTHWGHIPLASTQAEIHPVTRSLLLETGMTIWQLPTPLPLEGEGDAFRNALFQELGCRPFVDPMEPGICQVPARSLEQLAQEVKRRLGIPAVRVAGNPKMTCEKIGIFSGWDGADDGQQMEYLMRKGCDAVICGGTSEWSACQYVRDTCDRSSAKGLVVLGICNSEAPGMRAVGQWIRKNAPQIDVQHVPVEPLFGAL